MRWAAVPGARSYSVQVAGSPAGPFHTLATGLSTPAYSGVQQAVGTSFYAVTVSDLHGTGAASEPVAVTIEVPSAMGRMH